MTVSNTSVRLTTAHGNGTNTAFPFAFKTLSSSDVVVTYMDTLNNESTLALNSDYTVSLNPDQNASPGGTVNMLWTPALLTYITITTATTYTQQLALSNSGGFYPTSINDALDRIVIEIQQLYEMLTRASLKPKSGFGTLTPSNYVNGYDASGNSILVNLASINTQAVSTFMSGLLTSANTAALANTSGLAQAIQENIYSYSVASGTADAITASFSPVITSTTLASGVTTLIVRAAAANTTTAPTFTPNPGVVSPATIVKGNNLPLSASDISGAGHLLWMQWDITLSKWVLLNPANSIFSYFGIIQPASITLTNQSTVDFTGFPSTVKRVKFFIDEVSLNGISGAPTLNFFKTGAVDIGANYKYTYANFNSATLSTARSATGTTIPITINPNDATATMTGIIEIDINDSGAYFSSNAATSAAVQRLISGVNENITQSTFTGVRFSTSAGAFDAGKIGVCYE